MTEEEQRLLREEKQILEEEKSLLKGLNSKIGKLASSLERARIDEYTSMLARPWKFFLFNFLVGIFRGLGIAVGLTLIAAVVFYFLSKILVRMVDLPFIGMYIGEIVKFVDQYLKQGLPTR